MAAPASVEQQTSGLSSDFANLVEQVTARLQSGEPVDLEQVCRDHPAHETALKQLLPALRALAELSASASRGSPLGAAPPEAEPSGTLGDFRIVRELGRGGMGVVYEAEQISLARRVALKILPFAGVLDARSLQRFKNEAQAAAHLDHPNIVDVISVGCERGVHFYAMRYIDGMTLAEVIAELRREQGTGNRGQGTEEGSGFGVQGSGEEASRQEVQPPKQFVDAPTESYREPSNPEAPRPKVQDQRPKTHDQNPRSTIVAAGLSTEHGRHSRDHYRSIARLAIEAAEALDHAHQLGVVHRDVKPSNLMLDARGKLWVTDFGLAHVESNAELTMTGDILGTLRYMSPEQALAHRGLVDHRTDVYSLGATLYELLTLRPMFDLHNRPEMLKAIVFDEPRAPRKLDGGIPAELETIVLKCLEKTPADRYATAKELADDLGRFATGVPIVARPISGAERFWRWCRRNPVVAGLSGAVAVVLTAWAVTATGLAIRLNEALGAAETSAKAENSARADAEKAAQNEKHAKEAAQKNEAKALNNARQAENYLAAARRQHEETSNILRDLLERQQRGEKVSDQLKAAAQKLAADVEETAGVTKFAKVNYWDILGDGELNRGHSKEALSYFQRGYDRMKKIVEEDADDDKARGNFGVTAHKIGKVYLDSLDDPRQARRYLLEGRDLQQQAADHPRKNPFSANDNDRILALHELYVGRAELRLGHPAGAKRHFEAALEHRQAWLPRDPANTVPLRSLISEVHLWLGSDCAHLGDSAGTERHFGEALKICHDLEGQFPKSFDFKADLAQVYGDYGDAQLRSGMVDAALASYQKSLQYIQAVVAHAPNGTSRKPQLADALERLAAVAEAKHDDAEVKRQNEAAKTLRAQLVEAAPQNFAWRLAYARVLARCGQTTEAYGQATSALDEAGDRPSAQLQAARVFAVCAAKGASADERASYTTHALDALDGALGDDFHDPYVIRTDPDLSLLAADPRFQKVLERAAAAETEGK